MIKISVRKINKYTNIWEVKYGDNKKFSRFMSPDFKPTGRPIPYSFYNKILESSLLSTEKNVLLFMSLNVFVGSTVCLYGITGIQDKLKLSNSTVKRTIKSLRQKDAIITGRLLNSNGNMQNQFGVNLKWDDKDEESHDIISSNIIDSNNDDITTFIDDSVFLGIPNEELAKMEEFDESETDDLYRE